MKEKILSLDSTINHKMAGSLARLAKSKVEEVKRIRDAMCEMSKLDLCVNGRNDAIKNGKAVVSNWQQPTKEQVDKIFCSFKEDLVKK